MSTVTCQNLTDDFFNRAKETPEQPALLFQNDVFSYQRLEADISKLAGAFEFLGLRVGDTAALLLNNTPAFVISYYALLSIGVTVTPLNSRFTPDEINPVLQDAGVMLLVSDVSFSGVLKDLQSPFLKALVMDTTRLYASMDYSLDMVDSLADRYTVYELSELILREYTTQKSLPYVLDIRSTLATLIYTSGTTGKPKGVMLSHHNVFSNVHANIRTVALNATDCLLTTSPLFHVYGQTNVLLSALAVGARVALLRKFLPKRALDAIQRYHVTVLTAVPTMYLMMLAQLKERSFELSSLRVCHSGAAPMSVETCHHIEKAFQAPVQEGYGLSEASSIVCSNPLNGVRKPGSVGVPVQGFQIRVMCLNSGKPSAPGEVGELWVKGDSVMQGYYQQPEMTAQVLKQCEDGNWLRTRDIVFVDGDGYVHIVNRLDDLINIGGMKVYPKEIESVLMLHPSIEQAVVVDIPVSIEQQAIKAFVVLYPGQTLGKEQLRQHCLARLADYKVPRWFECVKVLPQSATGKILRTTLRQTALASELSLGVES